MSDKRLNQTEFPDASVVANFTKFFDEKTLQQSPAPVAFSTVTQTRKRSSEVKDEAPSFLYFSHKPDTGISNRSKSWDLLANVSMPSLPSFSEVQEKSRMRSMSLEEISKQKDNASGANLAKSFDGDESSLGLLSFEKLGSECSFENMSMGPLSHAALRSFHQSKRDVRLHSILEESIASSSNGAVENFAENDKKSVAEAGKDSISLRYLMPSEAEDLAQSVLANFVRGISIQRKLNLDDTNFQFPLPTAPGNSNVSASLQGENQSMSVDFRDDQISARSSSLGSSQRTVGTVNTAFSNIFRKYSLDSSFLRDDIAQNTELPSYLRSDFGSKDTASTVKAAGPNSGMVSSNSKETTFTSPHAANPLEFGNVAGFFGEGVNVDFNGINDNEIFVDAGEFEKGLDAVEEECVREHRFLQEEPMDGDGHEQNLSWVLQGSEQDITRPSWMSSMPDLAGERRVTVGQLFGARTEALGALDGENGTRNAKRPTFGIASSHDRGQVNMTAMMEKNLERVLGSDATPGRSFMPMVSDVEDMIRNASLSNDTMTMAQLALRLRDGKKTLKTDRDPSMVTMATVPPSVRRTDRSVRVGPATLETVNSTSGRMAQSRDRLLTESTSARAPRWNCPGTASGDWEPAGNLADFTLVPSYNGDFSQSVEVEDGFSGSSHCCVGTTSSIGMTVMNNTSKWLRGRIVLNMLLVDGQEAITESASVEHPSGFKIEPRCSTTIKVNFKPKVVGKWSMTFGFNILPTEERGTLMTIVKTVVVEVVTAQIEVTPDKVLHFGELPTDCCCVHEVTVRSVTPATVPIRVIIEEEHSPNGSWFYFPRTNSEGSASLLSENTVRCKVPGNDNKNENSGIRLLVALKTASSTGTDAVKMETRKVRFELDSGEETKTLAELKLKTVVGAIRLHTNVKYEPIVLTACGPSPACTRLTFKNSSKILLRASLGFKDHSGSFSAAPPEIALGPQEQVDDITISFQPRSAVIELESALRLQVQPDGPVFSIKVVGKVGRQAPVPEGTSCNTRPVVLENITRVETPLSPPVKGESNEALKRAERGGNNSTAGLRKITLSPEILVFGETRCGQEAVEKLKLSNKSSKVCKVTLVQPEESSFVISHTDLTVKAMHYVNVKIFFRPKTVGTFQCRVQVLVSQEEASGEFRLEARLEGRCV